MRLRHTAFGVSQQCAQSSGCRRVTTAVRENYNRNWAGAQADAGSEGGRATRSATADATRTYEIYGDDSVVDGISEMLGRMQARARRACAASAAFFRA